MDLPPIDKSLLAQCGIGHQTMPLPVADLGLCTKPTKPKKGLRKFDCIEALKLFVPAEAVRMNYIPQMLIALALEQTTLFVNYCIEHKIPHFKKHVRVLKESVEDYTKRLRESYFEAFEAYIRYVDNYLEETKTIMTQTWFTIGNVANKKIPNSEWIDTAIHITIIRELLDYAEAYDKKMDKIIAERTQEPVRRKQDKMLQAITMICLAIEEEYDIRLTPDKDINICIRVFENRATSLVNNIIDKELNVTKS